MKKYKYKVGQVVYLTGTKKIYVQGSKHQQKGTAKILSRHYDEAVGSAKYLIKVEETNALQLVRESSVSSQKEKVLTYLLVKDLGVWEKFAEKPEVVPEGAKLLTVMGVLND
jgi:hypothetical protein